MSNCKWKYHNCSLKSDCPSPYCKFDNDENLDMIIDLMDEYVEVREALEENK